MIDIKRCTCKESNSLKANLNNCSVCKQASNKYLQLEFTPPINVINDIWIGNISSCIKEVKLKELKIEQILIIGQECCLNLFEDIEYKRIPLNAEDYNISPYFNEIADFVGKTYKHNSTIELVNHSTISIGLSYLATRRPGVLIVDNEGGAKAGLAIAVYLIKHEKKSAEDACKLILSKKAINFTKESKERLREFELKLKLPDPADKEAVEEDKANAVEGLKDVDKEKTAGINDANATNKDSAGTGKDIKEQVTETDKHKKELELAKQESERKEAEKKEQEKKERERREEERRDQEKKEQQRKEEEQEREKKEREKREQQEKKGQQQQREQQKREEEQRVQEQKERERQEIIKEEDANQNKEELKADNNSNAKKEEQMQLERSEIEDSDKESQVNKYITV